MVGWELVWDAQELAYWHDDGPFTGKLDMPGRPHERNRTFDILRTGSGVASKCFVHWVAFLVNSRRSFHHAVLMQNFRTKITTVQVFE
ncbi:unnamed protein product [Umbelopsis vinacea]|jgi:hypothetical protein